ncbi:fungal zn(2)-Cys(6) binuclear cluster domain-containing protein [Ditylenchus destructor]|nr:fungal zn(2)-Cys(6) binuclear cluster domain-containing protein [Ditylenchus destructor]
MQIHDSSETPPSKQHRTPYVTQACLQCAKSKQRCDGQLPCGRCSTKQLECSYPPSKIDVHLRKHKGLISSSAEVPQQSENSTDSDITSLLYWPPSNIEPINGLSSQPSLAPDQDIESVFDVYGDFGCSGPSDHAISTATDDVPELAAAITQIVPPPVPSELEVDRFEPETPAPSLTQNFRSPHSSNERSSVRSLLAIYDCVDPDSDAWRAEDYCHVPRLSEDAYQEMAKHFARYNRDDEYWSTFTKSDFPAITHINIFIQVYFEEFHCLLPFLHKASFAPIKDHWILSLGVAAIGSIFSRTANSRMISYDLLELLRRAIHVQAVLLNQLGMMFGPETARIETVPTTRALLETLCRKMACYTDFNAFCQPLDSEKSGEDNWAAWIKKESLRRLFYSVWVSNTIPTGSTAHRSTLASSRTMPKHFRLQGSLALLRVSPTYYQCLFIHQFKSSTHFRAAGRYHATGHCSRQVTYLDPKQKRGADSP